MGVALNQQGKPEEAIEAYNKAIAIKPDYADAYNNMGVALKEQGKLARSNRGLQQKLLQSSLIMLKLIITWAMLFKVQSFNKPNRDLQKTIISQLEKETYTRPKDIAKAAISLLKFEPTVLYQHLEKLKLIY